MVAHAYDLSYVANQSLTLDPLALPSAARRCGCRGSVISTTWHTPAAGTAYVWLVLRDSRGGIATQALRVAVEP